MITNVEIYNNHIRQTKELSLTSKGLEDKIKQYPYRGENRVVDDSVENMLLPPIALVFYSLLYEYNDVPSPDDLVETYFDQPYFAFIPDNKVEVAYNGTSTVCDIESIVARVLRTYPSLLRDLHFYIMASEFNHFNAVRYSFKKDYEEKVDIQVLYRDKWYSIGLLLQSRRSLWYKIKKQFRHKPKDVIYIELSEQECKRVGDYMLYTEQHIQQLHKQLCKL